MPWESCWFVARPRWSKVLATTAKSYRAFMDAMDEDLVEFEDHWRPFPELLPFFRQESTLNELEIAWLASLLAEDPPRETMEAGLTPDAPWVAKHLPPPTLTPAQARLIAELGYVWCSAFPRPHRDRLASLSDEALEALASDGRTTRSRSRSSSRMVGRSSLSTPFRSPVPNEKRIAPSRSASLIV